MHEMHVGTIKVGYFIFRQSVGASRVVIAVGVVEVDNRTVSTANDERAAYPRGKIACRTQSLSQIWRIRRGGWRRSPLCVVVAVCGCCVCIEILHAVHRCSEPVLRENLQKFTDKNDLDSVHQALQTKYSAHPLLRRHVGRVEFFLWWSEASLDTPIGCSLGLQSPAPAWWSTKKL